MEGDAKGHFSPSLEPAEFMRHPAPCSGKPWGSMSATRRQRIAALLVASLTLNFFLHPVSSAPLCCDQRRG